MEAFAVIPEQAPHFPQVFEEAGKEAVGKDGFIKFMNRLPEDIAKKLKDHSIYLSDLNNTDKLLFAGVTE
jgi:hypothetical protein